jgi:putative ABC transport system permease protein
MTPLRLARLSLSRHRFATAITVISIGMSVACGGILLRLHQLSESRFSAMGRGGDAIVGAKAGGIEILLGSLNGEGNFPDFLPYKLFESLRAEQAITHGDGVVTRPLTLSPLYLLFILANTTTIELREQMRPFIDESDQTNP